MTYGPDRVCEYTAFDAVLAVAALLNPLRLE